MICQKIFLVSAFIASCQAGRYVNNRCPRGVQIVNCFVDPCSVTKCPLYPDAICVSNYCGDCNADFYNKNGKIVDCKTSRVCPYVPPCLYDFYYDFCKRDSDCKSTQLCCQTSCGKQCIQSVPQPPPCKYGIQLCKKNPCDGATCPSVPNAVCRPNYCEGCKAEWFYNGVQLSDMKCNEPLCDIACPASSCDGYICKGHEDDFQCIPSCDECKPDFYDENGNSIVCEKISQCPDGEPTVPCGGYDPCSNEKCLRYPQAECRVTTCGSCRAEFFVDEEQVNCNYEICPYNDLSRILCPADTDHDCKSDRDCGYDYVCCGFGCKNYCTVPLPPQPVCPWNAPQVRCIHPCEGATCPGYKHAVCRANFCGQCTAEWFVNGKPVKCMEPEGRCPVPPPGLITTCDVRCFGDDSCSGTEKCCPYGCSIRCMEPVYIEE